MDTGSSPRKDAGSLGKTGSFPTMVYRPQRGRRRSWLLLFVHMIRSMVVNLIPSLLNTSSSGAGKAQNRG